jgi:peroxiredoxin-like protein
MSEHKAKIEWKAAPHASKAGTYSRDHVGTMSTATVNVSAAPEYMGNDAFADPEQLLVNAVASCHMLYFLALCEGSGFAVSSYIDEAVGTVSKSPENTFWVSEIDLNPKVEFSSAKQPTADNLHRLHERAHKGCFIANSIKSKVNINLA